MEKGMGGEGALSKPSAQGSWEADGGEIESECSIVCPRRILSSSVRRSRRRTVNGRNRPGQEVQNQRRTNVAAEKAAHRDEEDRSA